MYNTEVRHGGIGEDYLLFMILQGFILMSYIDANGVPNTVNWFEACRGYFLFTFAVVRRSSFRHGPGPRFSRLIQSNPAGCQAAVGPTGSASSNRPSHNAVYDFIPVIIWSFFVNDRCKTPLRRNGCSRVVDWETENKVDLIGQEDDGR